jgi:hypothetical protein
MSSVFLPMDISFPLIFSLFAHTQQPFPAMLGPRGRLTRYQCFDTSTLVFHHYSIYSTPHFKKPIGLFQGQPRHVSLSCFHSEIGSALWIYLSVIILLLLLVPENSNPLDSVSESMCGIRNDLKHTHYVSYSTRVFV